jgi:hypothetical protein
LEARPCGIGVREIIRGIIFFRLATARRAVLLRAGHAKNTALRAVAKRKNHPAVRRCRQAAAFCRRWVLPWSFV